MRRKQSKLQSLIKQTKFRTTFELGIYFHQFTSVALAKQGYYYVTATLCPKMAIFKQPHTIPVQNNFSKTHSSKAFKIEYNNHTEFINHLTSFTFIIQQPIASNNSHKSSNLLLIFQLFRCKNEKSEEPQRKLNQDYESVSQFSFQLTTNESLTFLQYYSIKFQLPYAAQVNGLAICMITNFQGVDYDNFIQLEKDMLESKKIQKVQNYHLFIKNMKKLIKKHRFNSFLIQKALAEAFLGYKNIVTIPEAPLTQSGQFTNLISSLKKQKNREQQYPNQLSNIESSQIEMNFLQKSSSFIQKLPQLQQKQCSEQQFVRYLTLVQFEDKKIEQICKQLKTIGQKNQQSLKQLKKCIRLNSNNDIASVHSVNLDEIISQFQKKKKTLYSQKISLFGKNTLTAAEQMKVYLKSISNLKMRQKQSQNFFTKMNQLFNLIPDTHYEGQLSKFDKCPYVFYSYQTFQHDHQPIQDNQFNETTTKQVKQVVSHTPKKQQVRNLFILAHGYQASSVNMQRLKICLKKLFHKSKFLLLKSYSNHMDRSLQQMGQKAAKQIQGYLSQNAENSSKKVRIIMIGHSMGGIILRSSIQHLSEKTKNLFHTFISFATPHLGYLHCKSFITGTGIKLIESMHPSMSLKQLSNKDNVNIKETFIYKLSDAGSLKYFENIVTVSSIQDKYVPWNSARLQLYKEPEGIGGKNTTGGWSMNSEKHYLRYVEQQMLNHILGIGHKQQTKLKTIHRFEVDFNISQINLDSFIGRTSHVAFLANEHLLSIIFQNCLQKSLYCQLKHH